jgi:hypothetical protein
MHRDRADRERPRDAGLNVSRHHSARECIEEIVPTCAAGRLAVHNRCRKFCCDKGQRQLD